MKEHCYTVVNRKYSGNLIEYKLYSKKRNNWHYNYFKNFIKTGRGGEVGSDNKMKERKGESLFPFRRGSNRYSLHVDRVSKKQEDVQLKRASWSSFPLLRFSSIDDRSPKNCLSSKSHSSEEIQQQQVATTPKIGCGFLRGSTASIRSAFSSSSSTSSNPSIRSVTSSGKSSITSILEGSESESSGNVDEHSSVVGSRLARTSSDVILPLRHAHIFSEEQDTIWSDPAQTEDCSPTSPKIIFAHKKTPDICRKSRKQLVQELDFIKQNGSLPEDLELIPENVGEEKENVIPKREQKHTSKNKPNLKFMQSYKLLNRLEGKTTKSTAGETSRLENPRERSEGCQGSGRMGSDNDDSHHEPHHTLPARSEHPLPFSLSAFLSRCDHIHSQQNLTSSTLNSGLTSPTTEASDPHSEVQYVKSQYNIEQFGVSGFHVAEEPEHIEISSTVENLWDSKVKNLHRQVSDAHFGVINTEVVRESRCRLSQDVLEEVLFATHNPIVEVISGGRGGAENTSSLAHFSLITDIIEEEEESECDLNEFLNQSADSTCFERRLEDKLERMAGRDEDDHESLDEREVLLEDNASPPNPKNLTLKLDLTKPQHRAVEKVQEGRRLMRHISEENDGDSRSEDEVELRTPTTPRSPAIDIDDVFKQKQREIEESGDDMSRVRDLAARLKLATRRPSYLAWMGVIKERGEKLGASLATHTPSVIEGDHLNEDSNLTDDVRKSNLQSAVAWVRKELLEMKQQDQQLARQLIKLRIELQRLRLLRSCDNHQALVEEVANEAHEAKTYETSDLCELPADLRETFSSVLKEIGVTRMNITNRRFSLR